MQNIKSISKKLSKIWKKVYIVGWFCRERILNNQYEWDIDLSTDASPNELSKYLNVIKEVWKKYWTMIVNEWWEIFEITTFREDIWSLNFRKPVEVKFTDDLVLDSKRRDFTFNSIYLDINTDKYIDPNNWMTDLKDWIIRFVWNIWDRIEEDVLRILRYIRFKNKYSLKDAEINYWEIIKSKINLLKELPIERIKDEFEKILLLDNNIEALKELKEIWFFKILLPEVDLLTETEWWPKWHLEWDVWIHTLMTLDELNKIRRSSNWEYNKTIDYYWTLLLHDIGKHKTFSKDKNENVHYYDHETISAEQFWNISNRFKFSNDSSKRIKWLIQNHLHYFQVMKMKKTKAFKFITNKYRKDMLIIGKADNLWRLPRDIGISDKIESFYKTFIEEINTKTFLTWDDIILKYPHLKWIAIWNKLKEENDKILIK